MDVSQLAAKCRSDDNDACQGLADALDDWDPNGPLPPAKVYEVFNVACTKGSKEGCRQVGLALRNGNGVSGDGQKAVEVFKKGCSAGYLPSCRSLGVLYGNGLEVWNGRRLRRVGRAFTRTLHRRSFCWPKRATATTKPVPISH